MLKEKLGKLLLVADKLKWEELKELCDEVKSNIMLEAEDKEEYLEIKRLINNIVFQWIYRNTDLFQICNGGAEYDYNNFIIVKEGTDLEEIENIVDNNFTEFIGFVVGMDLCYEWGFSDEYASCNNCNELLQLFPPLSCMTRNFYVGEDGAYCNECCKKLNIEIEK